MTPAARRQALQWRLVITSADIPQWGYKLMLVATTVVWGFSYTVIKTVMDVVPPAWLTGIRCVAASLLLAVALWPRIRRAASPRLLGAGLLLGLFDFGGAYAQSVGLVHTTPGVSAFLTSTYCVIVPFVWWLIARRRPTAFNVAAALVAVCGIWLVSVSAAGESLSVGFGEGVTLVAAAMFAVHMVLVSKFSQRHDVIVLTVLQFATEGALGCLVGAATETLPAAAAVTPAVVWRLVFLTLLCTIACFAMQNVSLAHVPPAQGSLLLSFESVFGVLFSMLLYGERPTGRLVAGFALIFVAALLSEALPRWRQSIEERRAG